MATKYLIQDGAHYYTYIGVSKVDLGITPPTDQTFETQGFDDATLDIIDNTLYITFASPQLLMYTDATSTASPDVTLPATPEGTIATAETTRIDTRHYAGINKITVDGTGGKFAISFDAGVTWRAYEPGGITKRNVTGLAVPEAFDNNPANVGSLYIVNGPAAAICDAGAPTKVNMYRLHNWSNTAYRPKTWEVYGSLDNVSYTLLHSVTGYVWTDTVLPRDFYLPSDVTYRYYTFVGIAAESSPQYIHIAELEFCYDSSASIGWRTISAMNIDTLGMPKEALNSLTSNEYRLIFQQGDMDILSYIVGSETLNGISVDLPPNTAPKIENASLSCASIHKGVFFLSADLSDYENDMIRHRVVINDKTVKAWTPFRPSPYRLYEELNSTDLTIVGGENKVTLYVEDEVGNVSTKELSIIRNNNTPTVALESASSAYFKASIGDADNDRVWYRLSLRDNDLGITKELISRKADLSVPAVVYMVPEVMDISDGKNYTYVLDYGDDMGSASTAEFNFVGRARGLLFYNPVASAYYTDAGGNVVSPADLGGFYAGQDSSQPATIRLENRTGYDITDIKVKLVSDTPGVTIMIDDTTDFVDASDTIDLGAAIILDEGTYTFYSTAHADERAEPGTRKFKIFAKGTVI